MVAMAHTLLDALRYVNHERGNALDGCWRTGTSAPHDEALEEGPRTIWRSWLQPTDTNLPKVDNFT